VADAGERWSGHGRTAADEIAVVGTGLAGLVVALALAARNVPVTLIGPRVGAAAIARDTRSTALFGPSLLLLERIGSFGDLEGCTEPLVALRLVDGTGSLFRAPEVLFEASEIGEAAFGLNIENGPLLGALAARVEAHEGIRWLPTTVSTIEPAAEQVGLRLADGDSREAELVVGADGAQSPSRAAAGIATRHWTYPQVALASRFAHERPHRGVSTELHRRAGPLTTVPLPGNRSSLVWVETPAEAERLMGLGEAAFARELELALGSFLGAITEVGPRASFPIAGAAAASLGARRIALVGEAGHRLPPIGAQGLNLGLRDAAWLADLVSEAVAAGRDPGSPELLAAYDRARRADVASRAAVVDVLNRSLIAGLLPIDLARGAGLAALKAIAPLRQRFMREGMSPGGALPSLMRPA
jgi:2-octaprenyl-6-methoxyphenol hydroxylase